MPHLLHLDASARRESRSRALSGAFAAEWRAAHPDGRYTYRDLAAQPVPVIGQAWTEICDYALEHSITDPGRLTEGVRTAEQRAAWAVLEPLLTELISADVLLIGTPMYNFSIPASLKLWIDQVTFPRASLDVKVVVASARGGTYAPGTPRAPVDHQERYLRDFFLGHFQVADVTFVNAELVNATVDPILAQHRAAYEQSYATAKQRVVELARTVGADDGVTTGQPA
ncbi:NAD(P)H-dependent oxidoreductase [Dactylosporangium sp. NPDC051485]|uniref:FMN-dependent NADH-azoreductase n=1 Tax=Dactylosporangium sp. NPDC051485 TaxID=3154846 RepID=UPI0034318254